MLATGLGVVGEGGREERGGPLGCGLAHHEALQPVASHGFGARPGLVALDHIAALGSGGLAFLLAHLRDRLAPVAGIVAVVAVDVSVRLRVSAGA
jgi:hypothetical protein